MKIVGLSLLQPWASLMVMGAKKIETRSWPTRYRGWVAIHASKGFPKDARELADYDSTFVEALHAGGYEDSGKLPLGAIVAVGRLVDCMGTGALVMNLEPQEIAFGNYSPRRFGFIFEDVRQLPEPITAKGALSLWTPEPDVLTQLVEFIGESA